MVVFSDGQVGSTMETASDFSAWTGTTVDAGCTLEVSVAQQHHGNNSAHALLTAFSNWTTFQKSFVGIATAYLRCYVRFADFPSNGERLICMGSTGAAGDFPSTIGVYNDGGTVKWEMQYREAGGWLTSLLGTDLPALNTWYCVELKIVINAGAGESRFYLEGTEKLTATALTNNGEGNITQIRCGVWHRGGAGASMEDYIDCVYVDTAYIGPEAAGGDTRRLRRLLTNVGLAARTPKFQPRNLTLPKMLPRVM